MRGEIFVVRNEVDPEATFHCDALASQFPAAAEIDFPAGERFSLDNAAAVVFTGSTAGVYETDTHPWIDEQQELVRDLLANEIPTLGVCFGHQIVNSALGGTVESDEMTAGLVSTDLDECALFDGIDPVTPALHGDVVTEAGTDLDVIASAAHSRVFGTRHPDAPLWTVQFHPEIDESVEDSLTEFGWQHNGFSFEEVTAGQLFENFRRLAVEHSRS